MRSLFLTLVVLGPLLAGGCAAQIQEMPTWVAFGEDNLEGSNDTAVVVLKVTPSAEVLLAPGRIDPNGWRSKGKKSGVWLSAQGGFVVAKVSPTEDAAAYAVIGVRPDRLTGTAEGIAPTYESGFWSLVPGNAEPGTYGPTGETRVPLLKAIAARVTFVGAIRIDALGEADANEMPQKVGITPVTSPDDIEAVRRFMRKEYTKVTARVVPAPLQMMRRNEATE
jgi:hypothetical protein